MGNTLIVSTLFIPVFILGVFKDINTQNKYFVNVLNTFSIIFFKETFPLDSNQVTLLFRELVSVTES